MKQLSSPSLELFSSVETLHDETKAELHSRIRRAERRLARVDVWAGAVNRSMVGLSVGGVCVALALAPWLSTVWYDGPTSFWYVSSAVAAEVVLLLALVWPSDLTSDDGFFAWAIAISIASIAGLVGIIGGGWFESIDVIRLSATTAFLMETVVVMVFIALAVLGYATEYAGERLKLARDPEAVTIDALLNCLYYVERFQNRYVDADYHALMRQLELAALGIERVIPRRFRADDPGTDAWLRTTAQEAAAAVRDEKRALFAMRSVDTTTLPVRVAQTLENAARGHWAALRRAQVESMHVRRSRRLMTLASTVIKAAIPLVAVLILQQTRFKLGDHAATYTTGLAAAWAIVTLLYQYDPLFAPKLDALTKFSSLRERGH